MAGTVRAPGDEVGGYTVVRSLGAGGSGHVYLVRDGDAAPAALKLVDARADAVAAERLRREVSALQSLRHDAVPQVLDAELDEDETFVVFEFIPGDSLAQHVAVHGPLEGDELADFAERIAGALTAAHRAGVVHRDVTPSNVMIAPRGAVLIDFGLSHRTEDPRLTREGLVSGTSGYVAPEVIDGAEPGPIADRWSWAATVAYAMTGEAPYGTGSAAIRRTLAGKPQVGTGMGADAVRAALSKDIPDRPTMAEVVAALRGATQVLDALPATRVMPTSTRPVEEDPLASLSFADPLEEAPHSPGDLTAVMVVATDEWLTQADDDGYAHDDWDETEDADYEDADYDETDGDHEPPRPHRPLLLLSWTLTVSLGAALAPVLAFALLVLGALAGRATFRRSEAILAARIKHGERRRDAVLQTMSLPWHMTRAAVELLPSVIAAAVIGAGVTALVWWLVSSEVIASAAPRDQAWGHAIALAAGALAAAASLWWGLWSAGTREGAHRFAATLAPSPGVTALWVLVALLASAGILVAIWLEVLPWWWPLPQMPQ